jgi:Tfp pilus assembly protein FimT
MKTKKAFSLIELLIVTALATIMTAVLFVSKNNDLANKDVDAAARQVAAVLRQLQNDALAGKKVADVNGNLVSVCTFQFALKPDGSYVINYYSDCSNTPSSLISSSTPVKLKNVALSITTPASGTITYQSPRADTVDGNIQIIYKNATLQVLSKPGGSITVAAICAFTYSSWGSCQFDNKQYRSIVSQSPAGCAGGTPVLSQSCTFVPPTCNSWTYTPTQVCQPSNTQTVSASNPQPANCTGGTPLTTQACVYNAPTCTSWTYTPTQVCQPGGTQTVSASNPLPAGCVGGTPLSVQACSYVAPTCSSWTYTPTQVCQPDGTQTVSASNPLPAGCAGGTPLTKQFCTYIAPPTCTDGIKNGSETGIDCGGSCNACVQGAVDGICNAAGTGCTSGTFQNYRNWDWCAGFHYYWDEDWCLGSNGGKDSLCGVDYSDAEANC